MDASWGSGEPLIGVRLTSVWESGYLLLSLKRQGYVRVASSKLEQNGRRDATEVQLVVADGVRKLREVEDFEGMEVTNVAAHAHVPAEEQNQASSSVPPELAAVCAGAGGGLFDGASNQSKAKDPVRLDEADL